MKKNNMLDHDTTAELLDLDEIPKILETREIKIISYTENEGVIEIKEPEEENTTEIEVPEEISEIDQESEIKEKDEIEEIREKIEEIKEKKKEKKEKEDIEDIKEKIAEIKEKKVEKKEKKIKEKKPAKEEDEIDDVLLEPIVIEDEEEPEKSSKKDKQLRVVRLKPWVIVTMVIVLFFGFLFFAGKIVIWYLHVNENHTIQKNLGKMVITTYQDKEDELYDIDFQTLKEMNPDAVAYLKVKNTNIDYIVVQGDDNEYYLNHNFEKKWNVAGWIFGDYRNRFDETDINMIIYGHNTKDGSMFDSLVNVLKEEWQENEENYDILLVTEMGSYLFEVFSTYSITPEDYYIRTDFSGDQDYKEFLKTIEDRSNFNYPTKVSTSERILTLSSCIGDGKKRVVLHAKIKEKL